ncbi:uncharacterized protein PG998_013339 [Apiospora kogelbergensis]|uniref:uncharacterized protein n=1 Tax=Apiospora kogelbergensis TaxID=1337665 RepID=UPI00312EC85A
MPPDLTSTVVGVSSASMGAVTVGLALRLGTLLLVDRRLAWEDGLVLLSWLITISSVTYTIAIVTAKASLAALYLTVFRGRSNLLHTLNQGLLFFFVCEAVEEIAVVTSQCLPAISAWSSTGPGTCVNLKPFWWTTTSVAKIGADTTYDYALPYIWSEIDVCLVLLFSCGLSAREIWHSSSNSAPQTRQQQQQQRPRLVFKRPSSLALFRLPSLTQSQPREAVSSSTPDTFGDRVAWLELLNSHGPCVLTGDRRTQLGTHIRIEGGPPVQGGRRRQKPPLSRRIGAGVNE